MARIKSQSHINFLNAKLSSVKDQSQELESDSHCFTNLISKGCQDANLKHILSIFFSNIYWQQA